MAVADIAMVPSPGQIIRHSGERMQEVDADVSGRDLGSAAGAVRAVLATIQNGLVVTPARPHSRPTATSYQFRPL